MSFEVEGKLHRIFPTEQKTATFQAREFVLEIPDGNYPQVVKFQLVQDRCALLDEYQEGQSVKVHFDLRGREWNGKFLTNLNAWRVERGGGGQDAPAPADGDAFFPEDPFPKEEKGSSSDTPPTNIDDLPF